MKKLPSAQDILKLKKQGWSTGKIAFFYVLSVKIIEDVIYKHRKQLAEAEVEALPESLYRQVLRLWKEGMSRKEILELTGIAPSTLSAWVLSAGLRRGKSRESDSCGARRDGEEDE